MKFLIPLAIAIVVVFGFFAYWMLSRKKADGAGFLEYVRNPEAADYLSQELDERDAEIARLAERPPDELVAMLLEDADQYGIPSRAIEAAGSRVVPALLAAISDPRFRKVKHSGPLGEHEALEGVLSSLLEFAPLEAVPLVAPLAQDKDRWIRNEVAHLLGKTGTVEAIPPLKQLLADEDDYVRGGALRGIIDAIEAERAHPDFRAAMFEAVKPLAFRRESGVWGEAPRCLLLLDKQAAVAYLTDEVNLVAGRENLQYVLAALREANVDVSESQLLSILAEVEKEPTKRPSDRVMGQILFLLAKKDSDAARAAIDRGEKHPSQHVRECAAKARAESIGLANPLDATWDQVEKTGWENLNPAQKHVLSVRILIDEVENGGFLQYFVNSSGDRWRDAADGLTAIGAVDDRRLFDDVINRFGPDPPSSNRDTRHRQVAQIAKSSDRPFEEIERQFYKDLNDREVLLLRYIVQHGNEFRSGNNPQ